MRVRHLSILLCFFLIVIAPFSFAKDLGAIGAVYPILEPDLLKVIEVHVLTLQKNGELEKLNSNLQKTMQQQLLEPKTVPNLIRTQEPKTRLFDPSIQIPYGLKNAAGEIILPAGTTVNPLDTVSLSYTLVLYNAEDEIQVKWAIAEDQKLKGKDKLILVGGSVVNQSHLFHKAVYFDQGGVITARFQLHQVPVLITQEGKRLKIEEVKP